jgi:hypothetical protein
MENHKKRARRANKLMMIGLKSLLAISKAIMRTV